ncbi:MAG: dihydroneopterin aldolase [Pseudomonadota bacterium]
MSNVTQMAFAHPLERSRAMGHPARDRISVRDLVIDVEIGAFQAERGTTQRIRFNVVVEVTDHNAAFDDDVDKILSYDRVTEAIAAELSAERLNLLETLAERVADRILVDPMAARAFVRIEKLDRGPGTLGVEIVRDRPQDAGVRTLEDTPHPIVVFLSKTVVGSDNLKPWIDAAAAHERPVIFCVGLPDNALPQARHAMPQRRIDLLGIEQNAWILGSCDDRCVVVGTRTELDWGMRHDQIMVWAPSKMVLDAVDGPPTPVTDHDALTQWFAAEIEAAQVIFVGQDLPLGTDPANVML